VESAFLALGGPRLPARRVKVLARVLGVNSQDLVDEPSDPDPIAVAAHITRNVARLAALADVLGVNAGEAAVSPVSGTAAEFAL
jgi:hypothetical protein